MVTARAPSPPAAALRLPAPLAAGDAVALFSPSSHSGRSGQPHLDDALATLTGLGLRPLAAPQPQARHLYLAGADAQRAQEFERLYCDPAVKALFATRGGYGAARMLPHLDAARIAAAAPKAVVGMSDVGALFAYLHAEAGVAVLHGPCLAAPSFQASSRRAENLADLWALLQQPALAAEHACTVLSAPTAQGSARGRLVGGNLAVLASLVGTPWAVQTAGCILFLEEVRERPFRVDRCLTQLRQAGHLDALAGIVFGQMHDCDLDSPGLLRDVLRDLFRDAPWPVLTGVEAGHGERNRTLPLGRLAELHWSAAEDGAPAALRLI